MSVHVRVYYGSCCGKLEASEWSLVNAIMRKLSTERRMDTDLEINAGALYCIIYYKVVKRSV